MIEDSFLSLIASLCAVQISNTEISIERLASGVLQDVEAAGFAVDSVNQAVLIDDGVIDRDGTGGVVGGRWRNEVANFFDTWRGVGDSGDVD